MSKIKVSKLAEELKVHWKRIAEVYKEIKGESIKSPSKNIDEETANLIRDLIGMPEEEEKIEKVEEKKEKGKKYRVYDLHLEWKVSFDDVKEALKRSGYEGEISSFTEIDESLVNKVKEKLDEILREKREEEEKRRKREEIRRKIEEERRKLIEEQLKAEIGKEQKKEEKERPYKEDEVKDDITGEKEEKRKELKEKKREKVYKKDRKGFKERKEGKRFKDKKERFDKKKKKDFKDKKKREEAKAENRFEKIREKEERFSLQTEVEQAQIKSVKDEEKEREKVQAEERERRKESKEEKAELEALRKLLESTSKKKKKKKKKKEKEEKQEVEKQEEDEVKIAIIPEVLTVKDLSEILDIPANQIILELMKKGIFATVNQNIDPEVALEIAESHGFLAEIKREGEEVSITEELPEEEKAKLLGEEKEEEGELVERPPVVTVMGHVDHGKTTLLDTIRKTDVASREKGGITQHIGAYKIKLDNGKEITFLDTPGHEAFTTLRARGSKVADIAVLVVAADDGVKPQTVEAINHAKSANVPIIVAINKIDKPGADPERVKRELSQYNLIPEEWGGDTIMVPVSAKTGKNIDELLENILLVAELLELKANPNKPAIGTVIESKLDPKKGAVATVLIENGTLKRGDYFVAGHTWGKVRAMLDERGNNLKEASPGTPVEILGFQEVPKAGDKFIVKSSEREARQLAEQRKQKYEEELLAKRKRLHLENLKDAKEINIILKADVQGSLEAIIKSIEELAKKFENVNINIIHSGIGAITESDVMLAAASDGIVIGFNVRPDAAARRAAEEENIDIKIYGIIYDLIEDLEKALKGLLEPKKREELLGICEVKKIFRIKGVGTVAGCIVIEGVVRRNSKARLVRDGVVIYDGEISSLKRFKDDVKEVAKGYECGLMLKDFNDIKPGDQIESYEIVEEKEE
ncbi:MAG: translation initiation factor IF-2 [Persephonella sp.]|nr:MAG: translation initiation factor IF-2 [Persephonella sp.]RUM60087.1 MAG: translation initiation factor IF-2 [Persephonella sp.]